MKLSGVLLSATFATVLLGIPTSAAAQDDRWTPWLGCWERVSDDVIEGAAGLTGRSAFEDEQAPARVEAPRTCVTRTGGGVTITTTVAGQDPITQTVVADGAPRPIVDGECRGTERTEWSSNGRRLYARADATCGTEQRAISGLGFITSRGEWLDIRSFRIDGQDATRVSRYRRAEGVPAPGMSLSLSEIKEASGKVAAAVLEAALAESGTSVRADSRVLVELADANVPPSVIDVIVALSYPDRFRIATPSQQRNAYASARRGGATGFDPLYGYDPFYPAYYYSPFAFGYIGYYDRYLFAPYFYPGYSYYPGGGGGADPGDIPRGRGRAIEGVGYTRIVPADSAGGGTETGRRAVPRPQGEGGNVNPGGGSASSSGGSSSSGSSGSGDSAPSSGGGGSASPGGYSSGGDGGGGRTAQPR
jgi:hypothetical protein